MLGDEEGGGEEVVFRRGDKLEGNLGKGDGRFCFAVHQGQNDTSKAVSFDMSSKRFARTRRGFQKRALQYQIFYISLTQAVS